MELNALIRLRFGQMPPTSLPDPEPTDPREVDRLCDQLKWPEPYCAAWLAYAAGLPAVDPDGKAYEWTRRQVRGFLLMRYLLESGRLTR